jgi:hypothetical protein
VTVMTANLAQSNGVLFTVIPSPSPGISLCRRTRAGWGLRSQLPV